MPGWLPPVDRLRRQRITYHEPIVNAGRSTSSGQGPSPVVVGNSVLLLAFTLNVDDAYRGFKVPPNYIGSPSVHVHWTKTSDANENGKAVLWRMTILQFSGSGGDASTGSSNVEYEDTYDDSGTTTRIIHRTPNITIPDLTIGYYVGLKIVAVTPAGTPLASEPGLFSVDLMYDAWMNVVPP